MPSIQFHGFRHVDNSEKEALVWSGAARPPRPGAAPDEAPPATPGNSGVEQLRNIRSSAKEPASAWIKIKFRGNRFDITDSNLASPSSCSLLDAMFASIVGNAPGAKPLLTLPVK